MMLVNIFVIMSCMVDIVLGQLCQTNIMDIRKYLGCFVDTHDRLLPNKTVLGSSTDNNRCIFLCRDFGYMFAGSETSNQCYCGNDPWRYTAADVDPSYIQDYDCNYVCNADPTQICGGYWRASVYSTGLKNDTSNMALNGKKQRRYTKMAVGRTIDGSKTAIFSINAISEVLCAARCLLNGSCTGFVYSTIKGMCQLYGIKYQDLCDYTRTEGGSSIYMID